MIFVFKEEREPRMYVIQCLKRSRDGKSVFWKDNAQGYTENIHEAGVYDIEEVESCAGNFGDWIVHPIWNIGKEADKDEKLYALEKLKNLADRLSQNGALLRDW